MPHTQYLEQCLGSNRCSVNLCRETEFTLFLRTCVMYFNFYSDLTLISVMQSEARGVQIVMRSCGIR